MFRSVSMPVKSGVMGGEAVYNENTIRRIDIFLYPIEGTGSNAILHRRFDYSQSDGADGQTTGQIYLNEDKLLTLSGGIRRCEAYSIANLPNSYNFDDNAPANSSLSELKALALEGNFKNQNPSAYASNNITFVMDARDTIQFTSASSAVVATGTIHSNGPIELSRVASKLRVFVTVEPEITVESVIITGHSTTTMEDKWIPIMAYPQEDLKVYLANANNHGSVGGAPVAFSEGAESDPRLFNYPARSTSDRGPATIRFDSVLSPGIDSLVTFNNSYYAEPFYTYPMTWARGGKNEPFIKVEQSWGRVLKDPEGNYVTDASGNFVTDMVRKFYYKVFFPIVEFERNTWYETSVHLGLLGSETDETSLILEESHFYFVPWSNGFSGNSGIAEISGEVASARFLQVNYATDENGYLEIHNMEQLAVPYVTSHDCVITNVTARYDDYSDVNSTQVPIPSATAAGWLSLSGGNIIINHTLNNDLSSNDVNVGAFYIEFDLEHMDNPAFSKHVQIVQYPAMYITRQTSNGWVFVNGSNLGGPNNTYGTQRVNATSDSGDNIGSVEDPDSAMNGSKNVNPNLYTINVSVLNDNQLYLTDPRGAEESVARFNPGKLEHYRGTRSDAGYAVSPRFVIASSYGKTLTVTFENAKRRCAAYQENGYPQGRWRLPSPGEILFCVSLSNYGKIPSLFDGEYWCSSGDYYSTTQSRFVTGSGSRYIRCVYDTWAWGDAPVASALTTATWSQNL